jgi:hypothetical protein
MRKQLAGLYKELADQYKRMMKVSDEWRLTGLQEGADWRLQEAMELRKKMEAKRKEIYGM